jgi:hypothetical protein
MFFTIYRRADGQFSISKCDAGSTNAFFAARPIDSKRLIGLHNYTRGQIERGQSEEFGLCAQKGLFLRKKALAGTRKYILGSSALRTHL